MISMKDNCLNKEEKEASVFVLNLTSLAAIEKELRALLSAAVIASSGPQTLLAFHVRISAKLIKNDPTNHCLQKLLHVISSLAAKKPTSVSVFVDLIGPFPGSGGGPLVLPSASVAALLKPVTKCLKKLSLSRLNLTMGDNSNTGGPLGEVIRECHALQCCDIDTGDSFAAVVRQHQRQSQSQSQSQSLQTKTVPSLAALVLQHAPALTRLKLHADLRLHINVNTYLREAVQQSPTLQTLELRSRPASACDWTAICMLGQIIQDNPAQLKEIGANVQSHWLLTPITDGLRWNTNLQVLDLYRSGSEDDHDHGRDMDRENIRLFRNVLRDDNVSLQECSIWWWGLYYYYYDFSHTTQHSSGRSISSSVIPEWQELNFYLKLNRRGRNRLFHQKSHYRGKRHQQQQQRQSPPTREEWVDTILANQDDIAVIHYFLLNNPALVCS